MRGSGWPRRILRAKVRVGSIQNMKYERVDLLTLTFTIAKVDEVDQVDDDNSANRSTYNIALDVSDEIVVEESQTAHENFSGNVLMTAHFVRHHDRLTSPARALGSNADDDPFKITASNFQTSGNPHRGVLGAMASGTLCYSTFVGRGRRPCGLRWSPR